MQEGKQNIWNAPNILTMLRLLLIPIYWVLMMVRDNETAALIVFVTASITDLLDGYIARHFNQVTDWGKLFDPLADKLMVVSVMMTLVLKGAVPLIILIIIGIKEIIMVA
ncbi:MAG: CDP-alcohol phosphatidyltransferase family protein, partial [Clostridiales bacterium]|nr:CDP-alcohol phosphatidyltransferase family protein [Clostridiales bacterium]